MQALPFQSKGDAAVQSQADGIHKEAVQILLFDELLIIKNYEKFKLKGCIHSKYTMCRSQSRLVVHPMLC